MEPSQLTPQHWYWIRRDDGTLAPYLFHRIRPDRSTGQRTAEFFVGSMVQTWSISRVVAEAEMPAIGSRSARELSNR